MSSFDQPALFSTYTNPLLGRLGKDFFRTVPRAPGVYLFKNGSGEILYVGKAKNLRNRINSYKNARPNTVSRKVLRMLRLTQSIEFRLCENETQALLTENQLLRKHRPPFNVVNANPEGYYFIGIAVLAFAAVSPEKKIVRFKLTTNGESEDEGIRMFGVFRNRGLTRSSFQALLRLLSALEAEEPDFYFPAPLIRYRTPYLYALNVPIDLVKPLRKFLSGDSKAFLVQLVDKLLNNENIPKFIHHVISEDLKLLETFYAYGPRRVRRLRKINGIKRRVIAQDEIDDLLVLQRSDQMACRLQENPKREDGDTYDN